jgi:hypothetical protein
MITTMIATLCTLVIYLDSRWESQMVRDGLRWMWELLTPYEKN